MKVKNTKPEDMIQPCRKTPCHTHQLLFIAASSSRFEVISFPTITPVDIFFQNLTAAVIRSILILVLHFLFHSYYVVSFISGSNYIPLLFYSPFGCSYHGLSLPFQAEDKLVWLILTSSRFPYTLPPIFMFSCAIHIS